MRGREAISILLEDVNFLSLIGSLGPNWNVVVFRLSRAIPGLMLNGRGLMAIANVVRSLMGSTCVFVTHR